MKLPKHFAYSAQKDAWLKQHRSIGFGDIIAQIELGSDFSVMRHPNQTDYPHQHLIEVVIKDYSYLVPCIIKEETLNLITIYPSRKANKQRKNNSDNEFT